MTTVIIAFVIGSFIAIGCAISSYREYNRVMAQPDLYTNDIV